MTPEELFARALEKRTMNERREFLMQNCGADLALLRDVESLLSSFERAGEFLERPLFDPAQMRLADRNRGDSAERQA